MKSGFPGGKFRGAYKEFVVWFSALVKGRFRHMLIASCLLAPISSPLGTPAVAATAATATLSGIVFDVHRVAVGIWVWEWRCSGANGGTAITKRAIARVRST